MSVRVSQSLAEVLDVTPGNARVSQMNLEVIRDDPSRVRTSQVCLEVLHSLTNFTGYVSMIAVPVTI